jgi:DNA topoisomerase III
LKTLIVAEKPSVARDIAHELNVPKRGIIFENEHCIVTSARGHVFRMEPCDDPGFNLEALPVLPKRWRLEPVESAKDVVRLLREQLGRSDVGEVINACDAGREGEHIFRLIIESTRCKKMQSRMWLQSMTASGIRTAWSERQPATKFDPLAHAARARAIADWVVGVNMTRALTT